MISDVNLIYVDFTIDDLTQYDKIGTVESNRYEDGVVSLLYRKYRDIVVDRKSTNPTARPLCVFYANKELPLQHVRHSAEQIAEINRVGMVIALFEPLCLYRADQDPVEMVRKYYDYNHNFGFYSEFEQPIQDTDQYRANELDSIYDYVVANDLMPDKVHVLTCDYNVEKYCTYYNRFMKLEYLDLFLGSHIIYDNVVDQKPKTITKKFISTNWRYTSARCAISAILPHENTNLSWHFNVDYDFVNETLWLKPHAHSLISDRIRGGIEYLNSVAPLQLDTQYVGEEKPVSVTWGAAHFYPENIERFGSHLNPASVNRYNLPLAEYYAQSFVDVVNESRYAQPTANYSEKVLQTMQHHTPFIMVAPPFTLEIMREHGYKTFGDWWDESYDEDQDHYGRFCKIALLIDQINSMSTTELQAMHEEMLPVLEHNFAQTIKNMRRETLDGVPEEWTDEVDNVQFQN